jgi:hypothetical protein
MGVALPEILVLEKADITFSDVGLGIPNPRQKFFVS